MPAVPLDRAVAPLVLALDIGTSSARALAFDRHARAVAGSERQIGYELEATPDGGATLDPAMLFATTVACIDGTVNALGARAGEVVAVGISSFWHALLGIDAAGAPATPVLLWADRRSGPDVDALRAELDGEATHQRTGCVLHSSYWPGKLRWLARTDPDAAARVVRWGSFPEYLLWLLCGFDGTAVSMASGTGMLDVRRVVWDPEVIAAARVDERTLPPIVDLQDAPCRLRPAWAARWPALAKVPWYPALGDGACANAGTGAIDAHRIALSVGTSGAMRVVFDTAVGIDRIPKGFWVYLLDRAHALAGAAISNGGQVQGWLLDVTRTGYDDAEMVAVAALPPDGHGLTMLPFLTGERAPIWNDHVTGVIAGLTRATGRPELLRAGLEAVALRFARIYDGLADIAAPGHQIVATGGAILRSPAWLQITADALGRDLVALHPDEESSARGAAIVALATSGVIAGIGDVEDPARAGRVVTAAPERHAVYRAALARQRHLEHLLFPHGSAWDLGFGSV